LGTAVKWFNAEKCLEITVPIISSDKFTVCDSNDVDPFQEQGVADFLDAAAADIQNERAKELGQYFELAGGKKIEWEVSLQSTNNRESGWLVLAVNNAEVIRTGSGTRYRFYPEAGGVILPFDLQSDTIVQIVRTAEQNVDGSKSIFVEDIAVQDDIGFWYLKGDRIIESNEKLTIKWGQWLNFSNFGTNNFPTLTNKGTIILERGLATIVVDTLVVDPTTFINDGTIINSGGEIVLKNGMTNNGTIINNALIVIFSGTFTNNGSITNNGRFIVKRNGGSFVGNDVVGIEYN
jgi:hypothetical protein